MASALQAAAPPEASAEPLPLGTLTVTGTGDASCPASHQCTRFVVDCPGVSVDREGFYAVSSHASSVPPRGVVVLFSGGAGTIFWGVDDPDQAALIERLHADHGLIVAQVRWQGNWQSSAPGERAGAPAVACRPATVIRHLHDTLFAPLGLPDTPGICGFCVAGGSGGSAAVAYALSHYGLESVMDGAFPFSGPTHFAISKGCRRDRREEDVYWYVDGGNMDQPYGFAQRTGPCHLHDATWAATWEADSVGGPGSDLAHPATRVHVILGEGDVPSRTRGETYGQTLAAAGSPFVAVHVVPGMTHGLNAQGLAALEEALTWQTGHALAGCSNGLDDDSDGAADWPQDLGCVSADDAGERTIGAVCDDGIDQDADGRPDAPRDAGCASPTDADERGPSPCDNGVDDDADGAVDYPADRGCDTIADNVGTGTPERTNAYQCDNGTDDDGDGAADYRPAGGGDPQCASAVGASETGGGGGGYGSTLTIGNRDLIEGPAGVTTWCKIIVNVTPASSSAIRVRFATAPGTATPGSDYRTTSGEIRIAAGKTKRPVKIDVYGDAEPEGAETFYVDLSNPVGAQLGNSRGTCVIGNDD